MKLTEKQLRKIIREAISEYVFKKEPFNPNDHRVKSDNFDYENGKFNYGTHDISGSRFISVGDKQYDLGTKKGQEDFLWDRYSTNGMRDQEVNGIVGLFGNKNVGGDNWPSEGDDFLNDYDFREPGALGMAAQDDDRDIRDYARDKRWGSQKGDFRTRK